MKKIWCVIPVYNNAMTVHTVVRQCLRELPDVLVVDDGSTDMLTTQWTVRERT